MSKWRFIMITKLLKSIGALPQDAREELFKALPNFEDDAPAEPLAKQVNKGDISNIYMMEDAQGGAEANRLLLDYNQLRMMSAVPLVSAIINTRVNQIAEFSIPSHAGDTIGFQIRLKDSTKEPDDDELLTRQQLYDFMEHCGDPRINYESTLESFLRMLVRDSLIFDQACFEIIRNKAGDVCGFMNVDSATIRRSKMSEEEQEAGRRDPEGVHFVQVLNNKVVASFGAKDLCFGIRRPRSDIRFRGYGFPELEECIKTITNLLNAELYNASNFTNGISTSGIVAVKTAMNPQLFRAFRREFYSMLTGAHNAKKTPVIQLDPSQDEDIKAVNLSSSNREMEFDNWMNYNIKMICSVFQIDPVEVGFNFGQEGVTSSLNQASSTDKVVVSKERGLRPMLRAIQTWLNRYVIHELDDRFELVFTGLDIIEPQDKVDFDGKRVRSFMTIDEIRALHDLPALPNDLGSVILDPNFISQLASKKGVPSV